MKDLQVYSKRVIVEPDSADSNLVTLEGIDLGEVVTQFTIAEILDNMELSDVHDYVQKRLNNEDTE